MIVMAWEEMIRRLERLGYTEVKHIHKVTKVHGIRGVQKNAHSYQAFNAETEGYVRIIADCNAMKVLKVYKTNY